MQIPARGRSLRPIPLLLVLASLLWHTVQAQGLSGLREMTSDRLAEMGDRCFADNQIDTALACYGLLVSRPAGDSEDGRRRVISAYNSMGIIYMNAGDYRNAYNSLLDGLRMAEECGDTVVTPKLYSNIGNIYYYFHEYEMARDYYARALSLCRDPGRADGYYNNLGLAMSELGRRDSASACFRKALDICLGQGSDRSAAIYNSLASLHQRAGQWDSAHYYLSLSLREARRLRQTKYVIQNLSDISALYTAEGRRDSALIYLHRADSLARHHGVLKIVATNWLTRANLAEAEDDYADALDCYKRYAALSDSLLSAGVFGDITRSQRLYEVAKTDKQIEELVTKQSTRERIIYASLVALAVLAAGLWYIWRQKRNLNRAYTVLVEKNVEITALKDGMPTGKHDDKAPRKDYAGDAGGGLFDRIEAAMHDPGLVCDPECSVNKLAAAVHSNHTYVSQAITKATGKNFRQYLNGYRVNEAMRIFASPDAERYTLESVALRVGFKSRTTFYNAFQEMTGVTPGFYMKSLREKHKNTV